METDCCTYRPLNQMECGYLPYSFISGEIDDLAGNEIETEDVLESVLKEINRFIDLPKREKILILGDILLTFSMDWISTIHYPFFVGDNESGKSSVLHLGRWLCYRCMFSEDIPHANIYNFLGTDEEGTGTICEDEAQLLHKDGDKIRTYKSSYAKGSKKPRVIMTNNAKSQVFYNTFCAKWFAGERLPRDKGFMERLAVVHMVQGKPKSNIKRLTQKEQKRLDNIRKLLLMWKLQRIGRKPKVFDSGLTSRNQELWEDFLHVFVGTRFFAFAQDVVKHYTRQRRDTIEKSLEAKIFKILIGKLDEGNEVGSMSFWNTLTVGNPDLPGKLDGYTCRKFLPDEFDEELSPNVVSNILEDKFQGRKTARTKIHNGKQTKTTVYCFDEKILHKMKAKYGL